MSDWYDPIDIDAVIARTEVDPVYAALVKAQMDAELDDVYTDAATCFDCNTVLLEDEWGKEYCPQCDSRIEESYEAREP